MGKYKIPGIKYPEVFIQVEVMKYVVKNILSSTNLFKMLNK